jgi:hypothetical protein
MSKATSPYYPPRARWYAPLFYFAGEMQRGLGMRSVYLPDQMTWRGVALSLLVPGSGFYLRGLRLWGMAAMSTCVPLFLIFVLWLGYPVANFAFGMIVSIHTSGIAYYCSPFLAQWEFRWRLLFTVLVLFGLGFLVYAPLRSYIQNHWFMPVNSNGQVVVLKKTVTANAIHRGDTIAYQLSAYRFSNHYGQGILNDRTGMSLGLVLAMPGDHVSFSTNGFSVNGVLQPSLSHMPKSGEFVVDQNHWFVWPNLAISGNWNVGEANISSAMLQLSNVSENQFVAKPFKHWFWRKQTLL